MVSVSAMADVPEAEKALYAISLLGAWNEDADATKVSPLCASDVDTIAGWNGTGGGVLFSNNQSLSIASQHCVPYTAVVMSLK